MADKNLKIQITTAADTSGAKQATRSLDEIENELKQVTKEFRSAKAGSDEFTAAGRRVRELSQELDKAADATAALGTGGRRRNVGGAVLEFSRALEDAQYGIRGVQNNLPGLIAMLGGSAGLAGVISILAVVGSQLWERFSAGANASKKPVGDVLEKFEELKKVYQEIQDLTKSEREEAAKTAADGLKNNLSGIDTKAKFSLDEQSVEAARQKAEAQLELLRARIQLTETEGKITRASGEDAVKLAKEREATILRIFDTETKIAELARREALKAAEQKFEDAGAKKSELDKTAGADQAAFAALAEQIEKLRDEGLLLSQSWVTLRESLADLEKRLSAARDQAYDPQNPDRFGAQAEVNDLKQQIEDTKRKISDVEGEVVDRNAQAGALEGQLNDLKGKVEQSSNAQIESARAMADAARAMVTLSEKQGIERQSETELRATEEIGRVGQDVTRAAIDAIKAIQDNAAGQDRAVNPVEQEAIDRSKRLLDDNTPDSQQGGQLLGILQSLANSLTAKDQKLGSGVERLIRITDAATRRFEAMNDRISALESKVGQK